MLTKPKKKKKSPTVSQLKKKAWATFSLYIRTRDAVAWMAENPEYNGDLAAKCITCPKVYPATGVGCLQAGHFIPGRSNAYLFDEKQVNAQCYNCNMNLKGNWPVYLQVMIERYGQEEVDYMLNVQRRETMQFKPHLLTEIIDTYKEKTVALTNL